MAYPISNVVFESEFQDQNQDLELDIEITNVPDTRTKPKTKKNKRPYMNPYTMNRNQVRMGHFKDARNYDNNISEPDWEVQGWYARKKYTEWVKAIRKIPGWETFRRPLKEIFQKMEDENGNTYEVRKLVSNKTQSTRSKNKKTNIPDKGIKLDDEITRPKMFTEKMGKDIALHRNKLGLTQVDLGKKINVDANVIRDIEKGDLVNFNASDVVVRELSRVLGIPIRYLE